VRLPAQYRLVLMYRSYQLQADVPTGGQTSGALVHFTESTMGPNVSTTTPWIAYISCDVNETNASQEDGTCSSYLGVKLMIRYIHTSS
jgi:hypothetical protein